MPSCYGMTHYIYSLIMTIHTIMGFNMTDWRLYSTTDMVSYVDLGSPLALSDFAWANVNA